MIVMCNTNLVVLDTLKITGFGALLLPGVAYTPMTVMNVDDAPHGHMHMRFTDVRVPKENMILGMGRGFEVAQVGWDLVESTCMRSIGLAEAALKLL